MSDEELFKGEMEKWMVSLESFWFNFCVFTCFYMFENPEKCRF